ncbi:AraC family transcriptional regulator [Pelagicoccus mobilis]|uniref:Helix-turn-helix transcriptional regulator n=1 Tax=Pelagicoccus mobilis TaxID=415221 RepID=A0A934RUP4_9BACT|nr:AraC family transcriptional regulator [Pelagicoccus mobilis]MBK1875459.1 helix-turn-helix transcriptional regulator [Pelagicoccus mobilis]
MKTMNEIGAKRRVVPVEVPMPESGIYILESHHDASFHMPMGVWPFHKLCWVGIGRGLLVLEAGSVPLKRNDFVLVPANLPHRFADDPSEPMALVIACVANELVEGRGTLAQLYSKLRDAFPVNFPIRARSSFHLNGFRDAFHSMLREQSRAALGFEALIQGTLIQLMVGLLRGAESGGLGASGAQGAINGLIDYLETGFDKAIVLDELATQCGLSKRHFTQLFKEATGCSLVDYVNRKRIEYAKERLRGTGHIAYACYESGFSDISYFYRIFKRYVGCTPKAYLENE